MKTPKKVKQAQNEPNMNLAEFKAWLRGIEEMSGDNWSPSPEQWKKIRDRLHSVIDNNQQPAFTPSQSNISPPGESFTPTQGLIPAEQFYNQPMQPVHIPQVDSSELMKKSIIFDPVSGSGFA